MKIKIMKIIYAIIMQKLRRNTHINYMKYANIKQRLRKFFKQLFGNNYAKITHKLRKVCKKKSIMQICL